MVDAGSSPRPRSSRPRTSPSRPNTWSTPHRRVPARRAATSCGRPTRLGSSPRSWLTLDERAGVLQPGRGPASVRRSDHEGHPSPGSRQTTARIPTQGSFLSATGRTSSSWIGSARVAQVQMMALRAVDRRCISRREGGPWQRELCRFCPDGGTWRQAWRCWHAVLGRVRIPPGYVRGSLTGAVSLNRARISRLRVASPIA